MKEDVRMDEITWLRPEFGVLTQSQWDMLDRYFERLVEWNKNVNLTAITQRAEVYIKHFYDSLLMLRSARASQVFAGASRVADIGTGAGFPGLVLAIAASDKQFVLVDSLAKRLKFLEAVATELGLHNVQLVHGRAEDIGREPSHREGYDLVVSRAVARLNVLSELSLPLVKAGGWFVSYKGPSATEEVEESKKALLLLRSRVGFLETHPLLQNMGTRVLVGIQKEQPTSKQYPRKAGTPQKNPL